jgi:micrococcal nuclease
MKRRLVLVLCLFFLSFLAGLAEGREAEQVVKKVIDGDTIQLESGEIVRYVGIDAPELRRKDGPAEFFAREALRYNKKLVYLKKVRLEYDEERKDQYGRTLAYVYVKNLFVNAELVKLGYARALIKPPNIKYRDLLVGYQQKAMEQDRGLWQEKKQESEQYYIGNKRSYVLHRPSCKFADKIPEKSRIIFRSRVDALKMGYSPCRECKP